MTIFIYFILFLFGLAIGSFLNVVILRLPVKESLVKKSSHCPNCQKKLRWYELIPVLSFLFLKGKCGNCGKAISWQYPLVELATALLFLFVAWHTGDVFYQNAFFYRDLVFVAILIVVFVSDLRFYFIPDWVILPGIVFAFVINIFLFSGHENFLYNVLILFLTAVVSGCFFLLQYLLSRGKWIGFGDVKFGFFLGAALGMVWPSVAVALYFSYVIGAIVMIAFVVAKMKKLKDAAPFGVFLSVGTFLGLFFSQEIIEWYLSIL